MKVPYELCRLKDGYKCINNSYTILANAQHTTKDCPIFSIAVNDSIITYTTNIGINEGEAIYCSFMLIASN